MNDAQGQTGFLVELNSVNIPGRSRKIKLKKVNCCILRENKKKLSSKFAFKKKERKKEKTRGAKFLKSKIFL